MSITEAQVILRRQLANNLRADSDAIQDHLRMVEYLTMDQPSDGSLWTDSYLFSSKSICVNIDWASSVCPDANKSLAHALQLKVKALLPQLCREVLEDAAKRADTALVRLVDAAPPEDATTIAKVLGGPVQAGD